MSVKIRRREFITILGGAAAAWPLAVAGGRPGLQNVALAQQATKIAHVGWLSASPVARDLPARTSDRNAGKSDDVEAGTKIASERQLRAAAKTALKKADRFWRLAQKAPSESYKKHCAEQARGASEMAADKMRQANELRGPARPLPSKTQKTGRRGSIQRLALCPPTL